MLVAYFSHSSHRARAWVAGGALALLGGGPAAAQPTMVAGGRPFVLNVAPTDVPTAARAAAPGTVVLELGRQRLGLTRADSLRVERTATDARGEQHVRYQQVHEGIPVEHGFLTAHYRSGRLARLSGELKHPTQAAQPALTVDAARRQALAAVGATHYLWQDAAEEAALRRQTADPAATWYPAGTLTWVEPLGLQVGPAGPVLAWRFDVYATAPLSREWVYVDAASGQVVLRDPRLHHAQGHPLARGGQRAAAAPATTSAVATFATRYSGSRTSTTGRTGTRYWLRDSTRGGGVNTYNLNRTTVFSDATDFTDNDNNWTAAEYNNGRKDNAALDVHWGTQAVYDYWWQRHGRNSFDGAGARLDSYVHYSTNFGNAFWDGSRMTYGDGDNLFNPMTSLDIVGHEIGHGICEHTAYLVGDGRMRHPAAMNEGLSDVWGACVEHFADSTKDIWEGGNEVTTYGGSLRSMRNPKLHFNPDTYRGLYWVEHRYAEPHRNSTIISHWFYLLSVGGTGTNDLGHAYAVTGIGIRKAAQLTYHLEAMYMTPTSNYPDAYRASLAAADDLYGADSPEMRAVAAAWYAVGVGDAAPIITGLLPAQGGVGAVVTITGYNFGPVQRVMFNGTNAPDFTVLDSVHLRVRVPAGATTGAVTVTAPMGTATAPSIFVVTSQGPAPVVTSFAPAAGQRVGGVVTITGQNLGGATGVWFGGVPAAQVTAVSATQVTAVVPPLGVTGWLTLEATGGQATAPDTCRVLPTLTGFSPASGPVGTRLILTGTGLTGATRVTVNNAMTTLFPGATATSVEVIIAPGTTSGRVRIVTAGGTATSATDFVVTASAAPVLLSFLPARGGPNTVVTLRGHGLAGTTAVAFGGGFAAASFEALNDSLLTAVVPLPALTGPIRVTTPGGSVVTTTVFTVTAAACRLAATIATDGPACVAPGGQVKLRADVTGPSLTTSYSVAPIPYAPYPEPDSVGVSGYWGLLRDLRIGFPFQFFGKPVTKFSMSSSANIQFSGYISTPMLAAPIPWFETPQNFIALAWHTWMPLWNAQGAGRTRYGVEGTAPNRVMVVSYYKVNNTLSVHDSLTAQIVLHESTNEVDLIYTSTGQRAWTMAAGLENSTGDIGVNLPNRVSEWDPWRAERVAWRFTPISVPSPLTYKWSPTTGLSDSTQAEVMATPTVPTTYTLTVKDGRCTTTASVLLTPAPATPPGAAPVVRCGPGSVTLTASGAPAGGSYRWYDAPTGGSPLSGGTGASFTTPSLSATTTYYVATVAAGGCESLRTARTALIGTAAAPPTVRAAPATVLLGQSTTLEVAWPQPGVVYTWRGPGLPVAGSLGARVTATPTGAGAAVYTLTAATPTCGTPAQATLTVAVSAAGTAPQLLSFVPTSGPVGHSVTITGVNFASVTAVAFAGSGTAAVPTAIRARTATSLTVKVPPGALPGALRLTYAGGTEVSADAFCVEMAAVGGTGRRCGPGAVVVTASGAPAGGRYRWYAVPTGGTPLAETATGTFTTPPLTRDTQFYVAVVLPGATCEGARATVNARVTPLPVMTIGSSGPTTFCQGNSVFLYASGGTEQRWSNGETSWAIRVDTSGTYTVTGTMYGSCPVTSAPVTVTVVPRPAASLRYSSFDFCGQDPDVTPTITGATGGSFWATPAGIDLDATTGRVRLSRSVPGTYMVSYGITSACADSTLDTVPFIIREAPVVTLTAGGPTTFCLGDSVAVALTAAGAPAYTWSTGDTARTITVRAAGTYSVVGTGPNGCASAVVAQVVAIQPPPAVPIISQAPQPGGQVLLTSSAAAGNQWYLNTQPISGATAPTYLVTPTAQAATYTVVVTDTLGCGTATSAPLTVVITGVGRPADGAILALAPNPVPAGQPVRLTISGGRPAEPQVQVLDVLGRVVLRLPLAPSPTDAAFVCELPTRHLTPGVYTIRVGGATRRLVVE